MDIQELSTSQHIHEYISKFVTHPLFLTVKDAFTNHTPNGTDSSEASTSVAHGKNLGTRFVFNEMERLTKNPSFLTKAEKTKPTSRRNTDPDLEA